MVDASIDQLQTGAFGTFNLATKHWLTLEQIKLAFENLSEPVYTSIKAGPFSYSDEQTLEVYTPPITSYFAEIKNGQRS